MELPGCGELPAVVLDARLSPPRSLIRSLHNLAKQNVVLYQESVTSGISFVCVVLDF